MSDHTLSRSMHDIGLAAWFGGSLMGAVGLNGAADTISEPARRIAVGAAGWNRWLPVNAAALALHAAGGVGLLRANRRRVAVQRGARANTTVKTVLTGVAAATTLYTAWQTRKQAEAGAFAADGELNSGWDTPAAADTAHQHLRLAQWVTPAVTGVLIVLGAQQGEQQRASRVVSGVLGRARDAVS